MDEIWRIERKRKKKKKEKAEENKRDRLTLLCRRVGTLPAGVDEE